MQKIGDIIPYFKKELSPLFEKREVISWAYLSIEYLLDYNRSDCILNINKNINKNISNKLEKIIDQLKTNKPLQYILNETYFYGLKLQVNKHTLIPRQETESLIDWILEGKFTSAIDIGTGSGCIAIALAKNSNANITAIDISSQSLKVANYNASLNNVSINFIQQDILSAKYLPKTDLIVSNPPYILNSEKKHLQKNILEHEPHLALFVSDKNPLIFYQHIINIATNSLLKGGGLFFEINENYANEIISLLTSSHFVDIELKKDINDRDRMIKAIWK
tara:strand:- start:15371 stop:16204 length:834 start_codon:yes stop_codon:yes gene_type:complete